MYVEIGNNHAIEGYRDPTGSDPDIVLYRTVPGERTTSMVFPDGLGLQEALATSIAALSHHIEPGEVPVWIESDSPGLQTLLMEHYGITERKNVRPAAWGKRADS